MSTRYLRRVYGNEVITNKDDNDENTSDIAPIAQDSKAKSYNVFNLLNEDLASDDKEVDDDDDNEDDNTAVENEHVDNGKRKKKKKKKKRIEKPIVYQDNSKDDPVENVIVDDEIERTVREVNKLLGEPIASSSKNNDDNPAQTTKQSILMVQHKFLNAANELKKICGSKMTGEQNKNRNRGRTGHLKKTWLTTITDWISTGKSGLSMSIDTTIKSDDDTQYFVFVHSSAYQQVQKQFFAAVDSQNPDNIISILNGRPYHVDALLQFADLCKLNEDLQMSAEFVERAVHCLECTFHPLFNMTTGNCRLNYKKQTNRALFIALFKHLMFIGGRACYRTSLELCKVLLSFDPAGDPLAIILTIDLYAISAKEYQWFIDFCEFWESSRNLTQLPNIAYGLALVHYHLGHQQIANELLQNALIMFPGVLVNLLDKCGVATDTRLLGHDHFNSKAKATTSPALEKLQNLYVIRTNHLWKEAASISMLPWIENAANIVMNRYDNGDEYIKFCEIKRTKRYQGQPPRNILRHIILSDIKEVTITHPGMPTEGPIFSYDPLPPADSIDIYVRSGTVHRPAPSNSNLFSLFVSSLFMDLEGNPVNADMHNLNIADGNEPPEFD